ncbi:MAG: hypothetical protein ACYSYV_08910 [Planctomycetota bacterium]|jgi:hypothetical protein
MGWFDITIEGLMIIYIIVPIPLTIVIESYFFKTRHLTLVKTTIIWFVSNILTFILLRAVLILFRTLNAYYLQEYYLILIYTVGLLIFLPLILKIFLRNRFGFLQVLKIACPYILFFEVVSFGMLGLGEFKRYKRRYAHVVYANSTAERKKQVFDNFLDWTELKLPDSTSLIFGNCPKDYCGAMKIEIDRKDMLEFETQLKEKYPQLYSELKRKSLNEDERSRWNWWAPRRFWRPFSAVNFKTASTPKVEPTIIGSSRPSLDMFIDLDDEKKALIYMIYSAF